MYVKVAIPEEPGINGVDECSAMQLEYNLQSFRWPGVSAAASVWAAG